MLIIPILVTLALHENRREILKKLLPVQKQRQEGKREKRQEVAVENLPMN